MAIRPDSRVGGSPGVLRGRERECAMLDRLLAAVVAGDSRSLTVRGEAGIGKTALLDYVAGRASGCTVLRAAGVESEMELAFAGVQQLCAPLLDRLDRLAGPQRAALETAFALSEGEPPDSFLVALAVLSLLGEAAEEQPLVCLVDDAQWLDRASAQVLAFVARRLLAESIAFVFGSRSTNGRQELTGLQELVVEGLDDDSARAVLDAVISGPLDERVRERIVAETRGNPLALLELPRGPTPAGGARGFGPEEAAPVPVRIERSFARRIARMSPETQLVLLAGAADPIGDPMLLRRAADRLELDVDAALAEAVGLIDVGARVRFRHPLIRSAVYERAPAAERQRVHAALAQALVPEGDPDRYAWHRANAAIGPDEAVAAELEASALRTQARGGLAAAAAFLERAVELTPDPRRRAQRALEAAGAAHAAGAQDAALELLVVARDGPLDELLDARRQLLDAQIAFSSHRGRDGAARLAAAAQRLEPLDAALSRASYLEAMWAACIASHLAGSSGPLEVSTAARGGPLAPEPRHMGDLMLDGLATRFVDGYPAGAPTLQRALNEFVAADLPGPGQLPWVWLAVELWDTRAWRDLAAKEVAATRDAGALSVLPIALHTLAAWHVFAGDLRLAATLLDEADSIMEATGDAPMSHARVMLMALRDANAEPLIDASILDATERGEGVLVRHAEHAAAWLYNGLGRYDDALRWARRERQHNPYAFYMTALPELVEAAVRSGDLESAASAVDELSVKTQAAATPWARGIEARSRALVGEGDRAETLYRESIAQLDASGVGIERARAQLLYGEWLRRQRRRQDARGQLRAAYDSLHAMGAHPFAERAASELAAAGEATHRRAPETRDELTAHEAQVARFAADGLSNGEIGSQLFMSARTVDFHLGRVLGKLGISSREQLNDVLPAEQNAA
jgi:DNA-binding CsgD family transcriptional regulator